METGHVVYFASQKHPFLVEATPCLELDCSCSIVTLALSELVPPGSPPRDRLKFSLRVCLRTWVEHDPPPRSLEVESLVREFLALRAKRLEHPVKVRLHLPMETEPLQHGKAEGDEWDNGQKSRVNQAHGAKRELAFRYVAPDRVHVSEHDDTGVAQSGLH